MSLGDTCTEMAATLAPAGLWFCGSESRAGRVSMAWGPPMPCVHAKRLCCVGGPWQMGCRPWREVCEHRSESGRMRMPWGASAGSLASACATL